MSIVESYAHIQYSDERFIYTLSKINATYVENAQSRNETITNKDELDGIMDRVESVAKVEKNY